jgi:biotin carboxylase
LNKYLQRVVLSRAGICNPHFSLAENADDVRHLARNFGFPLVLKCVISTMSRLVTPIWNEEEIDPSVARMLNALPKSNDVFRLISFAQMTKVEMGCAPMSQFLVESFADGDMVETDGLAGGQAPFTFGVTEQVQSVDPPFFIEGYLFPAECTDNGPIEAVSNTIVETIDLRYSGFSIELRVKDGEICLIEVNGRLGWDDGFGDLFQVRTHRDRILQALQLTLGIEPESIHDTAHCAAIAYRPCYHDGIVEDLPTREELAQLEDAALRFGLSTHKGARFVAPPNPNAYPHVAWALARHPTSSHTAYELARRAVDQLEVYIRQV